MKLAETKANSYTDAMTMKAKELYGKTAQQYGVTNNKRDGALMAQGPDWRNANQRAIETDSPLKGSQDLNPTGRKYQNLQSSVFGGGYVEKEPIEFERGAGPSKYSSTASWTTEAAKAQPNNGITHQDAFRQRQKELHSEVLPKSDYTNYAPESKNKIQSFNDNTIAREAQRQPTNNKKTNDEFKQGKPRFEPCDEKYDAETLSR